MVKNIFTPLTVAPSHLLALIVQTRTAPKNEPDPGVNRRSALTARAPIRRTTVSVLPILTSFGPEKPKRERQLAKRPPDPLKLPPLRHRYVLPPLPPQVVPVASPVEKPKTSPEVVQTAASSRPPPRSHRVSDTTRRSNRYVGTCSGSSQTD